MLMQSIILEFDVNHKCSPQQQFISVHMETPTGCWIPDSDAISGCQIPVAACKEMVFYSPHIKYTYNIGG